MNKIKLNENSCSLIISIASAKSLFKIHFDLLSDFQFFCTCKENNILTLSRFLLCAETVHHVGILSSPGKVRIPILLSTSLVLYKFLHCTEHMYIVDIQDIFQVPG